VRPQDQALAHGLGCGRELFANQRRHALSAEEGACSWL
jgi:phosphogluconate dehydratase